MKLEEQKCTRKYICNDFLNGMDEEQAEVALILASRQVSFINRKVVQTEKGKWRDVSIEQRVNPHDLQIEAERGLMKILCEARLRVLGKIVTDNGGYLIEIPEK